MISDQTTIDGYITPADASACRVRLMQLLATPVEKWIILYEASMADFWSELNAMAAPPHPIHLYADASLAKRPAEHGSLTLAKRHGVDVAIGTSNLGRYFVCHSKVIACNPEDGQTQGLCWEGSLNFSDTAWAEPNTVLVFRSNAYRDLIKQQWEELAGWARSNEADMQL